MRRRWSSMSLAVAVVLAVPVLVPGSPVAGAAGSKPTITASGFTFVPDDSGGTFAGEVTAAAVVENPTGKVATTVRVVLALKDDRGRVIQEDEQSISYIAPGDEAYAVWTTTYPQTKVPVELTAKVIDPGEMVSPRAWAEDAQYTLGAGEFGADAPIPISDVAVEFADLRYHDAGLQSSIVGTVRSTSGKELTGLDVTCAAFEGNEVVGGGHMVLAVIPEGSDAGIQAMNLTEGLTPDEFRCSARVEYLRARVGTLEESLVVAGAGFSLTSIGDYTMGAVVENPSDKWAWGLDVGFDVLDANGRVVGARMESEPIYVPPGGAVFVAPTLPGSPREYAGVPASLRVHANAGVFLKAGRAIKEEAGFDPAAWTFEFSDLAVVDGSVTGTITSRAKRPLNALEVTCGLFLGETIVGGTSSTIDESELGGPLRPGAPTAFEAGAALDGTGADSVRCVGTITGLSDV